MKFSIIIPVYNTEAYIIKCLESIHNQPYKDYEVIIIDDESPDNSKSMIQDYIVDKPQFQLYSIKNRGVSGARNFGVSLASGEYLLFLDSDDSLFENRLAQLALYLKQHPVDVCFLTWLNYFPNAKKEYRVYPSHQYFNDFNMLDGRSVLFEMLEKNSEWELYPWSQCYLRRFYLENKLSFQEGIIFEDMIFNWQAVLCAKSVAVFQDPFICYLKKREGQITRQITLKSVLNRIYVSQFWVDHYKKYHFNQRETYYFLSRISYLYLSAITLTGALTKQEQDQVFDKLSQCKMLLDYGPNCWIQSFFSLVKLFGFESITRMIGKKVIPFYRN